MADEWKKGKILWFELSGEGIIMAEDGKNYFLHKSALLLTSTLNTLSKTKKITSNELTIKNNTEIKFTVYENSYQELVEKVKLVN